MRLIILFVALAVLLILPFEGTVEAQCLAEHSRTYCEGPGAWFMDTDQKYGVGILMGPTGEITPFLSDPPSRAPLRSESPFAETPRAPRGPATRGAPDPFSSGTILYTPFGGFGSEGSWYYGGYDGR